MRHSKKTVVAFVNGISTSHDDYVIQQGALSDEIKASLGCELVLIDTYNTSVSKAEDIYESSQLLGNPIEPQLAQMIITGAIDLASAKFGAFAVDAARFFIDELVRTIAELEGLVTTPMQADLLSHLTSYHTLLAKGYHLVIIGHSEGNLFANTEYDILVAQDSHNAGRVTVIGVATPSYRIAGDVQNQRYTTVRGDFIWKVRDVDGRQALEWNTSFGDCATDPSVENPLRAVECHYLDTYLAHAWSQLLAHLRAGLNHGPTGYAGPDQVITLPDVGVLAASVTDDGFHTGGDVHVQWDQITGPAEVTFDDPTSLSTTAAFSVPGTYILRLKTYDSLASWFDFVTIVAQPSVGPPPPLPNNQPPAGSLDGVNTLNQVFGWARDPDDTNATLDVHLYIDKNAGTPGATPIVVTANKPRDDLDGNHAFNWTIPTDLRDGQPHRVWAWGIDLTDPAKNAPLSGSPRDFTHSPPAVSDLPNTGTAAPGSADPYWILFTGPTCPAGNCVTHTAGGDSFSRWTVPNLDSVMPGGQYVYRLSFLVKSSELATAGVVGRWATDDRGLDIRVNGASTGYRTNSTFDFAPFTITSGLVAGVNTLDFVVENQTCPNCPVNPAALRVEFGPRPLAVRPGSWPISGRDPQRTGRSDYLGPGGAPTAPQWQFNTGAPIVRDLAVGVDGIVYFASDDLYALRPDGTMYARAALTGTRAGRPFMSAPALDDTRGYVFVAQSSPSGGWDVLRFDKLLSRYDVVAHGSQLGVSSLIVDGGTLFFFAGGQAYAIGDVNWTSDSCSAVTDVGGASGRGWQGAPTIGPSGSIYGVCNTQSFGGAFNAALLRLDRGSGVTVRSAFYQRGASEITIDGNGFLRVGYQAFTGATFIGGFDRFDANLNLVISTFGDYTSSRAAVFSDTTSTVRIGYSFTGQTVILSSRGAYVWNVTLPTSEGLTAPTVDRDGAIFVGNGSVLVAVNPEDGSTRWTTTVNGTITTQPVVSEDHVVYVGTSSGTIYRLRN